MASSVADILDRVRATRSRKEKEQILQDNAGNEVLKRVFYLAYDKDIVFGIKKIPSYTPNPTGQHNLEWAFDKLPALYNREVTGNAALQYLTDVLCSLDAKDSAVVEAVIKKDLDIGASAKTANKAWPNLISEFPVMAATPDDQKARDKITGRPLIVQMKADGMRVNAVVKNGDVRLHAARSGKEFYCYDEKLVADILRLWEVNGRHDMVFDGEAIAAGPDGKDLPRKTSNGLCNKASRGTISEKEMSQICFKLWDMIPVSDWEAGKFNKPYRDRWTNLKILLGSLSEYHLTRVGLVATDHVHTWDEANKIASDYIKDGHEGAIVKDPNMIWENRRSRGQVKIKDVKTGDFRVVDIIWSQETKYQGMIGSLVCESADGKVQFSTGSGLSDKDRQTMGNEVIGKIVEVAYNEKITSKGGDKPTSLYLPIFKGIRHDKTEANYENELE